MKLLVVRPQPGADATAARAKAAGFEASVMPMFAIEPLAWKAPDISACDALFLTSGNAVRMAGPQLQHLQGLPVYAVGSATAAALKEVGLTAVATGTAGVEALFDAARTDGRRKLLWLAGEDRTEAQMPAGMEMDIRTVYRSAPLEKPPEFDANVEQTAAVLIHSARAAQHFSDLCIAHAIDRSSVTLAVLSPNIAQAAGTGWRAVVIAPEPNDATLLSALQRHFTTPSRDP